MLFRISKTTWSLMFSCICMFALGLGDNIRGPLFPELINFFGLSNSVGSLSFACASSAALVGTILSTFILRKIHLDKLLTFSILLMGFGLLVVGLASDFKIFLLGSVFFGFALGTTAVAQNLLITENVKKEMQTKALSGLHSLYGFSSLLAPYLAAHSAPFFLKYQPEWTFLTDWRSAYFVTSILCVLMFLGLSSTSATPDFAYTKPEKPSSVKGVNFKAVALMSGFFASYVGAEILVSTRLALYMRTYFGMNLEQSSQYVTYFFVFLLAGRLLFTLKSLKLNVKLQMNACLLLSLVFLALGMWAHPFFLTLVGLSMAPFYPLAVAYISDITGVYKRKYLTTVMAVQGVFVISMHIGVGYMTDTLGLFSAFGVGIILLLLSLICLNTHPKISL
jgi:FHS family glucose/mannose:H+ symporter-like MFS transporter